MEIRVRRAVEGDRRGIALCIAEGFERDFSAICKDTGKVAKAISGGLRTERFYVAEIGGELAGVAAISDCTGRAAAADGRSYRREFGLVRGMIAALVLREEFEAKLDYPETTGYIEFVAVKKEHRRKGVAAALLREGISQSGYREFALDVTDINTPAIQCYSKLGFKEFKRVDERRGRQKGFNAKIYMRYSRDGDT